MENLKKIAEYSKDFKVIKALIRLNIKEVNEALLLNKDQDISNLVDLSFNADDEYKEKLLNHPNITKDIEMYLKSPRFRSFFSEFLAN